MKFTSFVRMFSANWQPEASGRRRGKSTRAARKTPSQRLLLETLEDRTLLSVIPSPVATVNDNITQSISAGNHNTPSVAVDPANPQDLVAAWVRNDPKNLPATNPVIVEAAYSNNGGSTWHSLSLPGGTLLPAFVEDTDDSVAFDRAGNFYIVYAEHSATNSTGAIVLQKFTFPVGGAPTQTISSNVVYEWVQDPAFTPMVAVDTSPQSPFVNNVYVTWSSNNVASTGVKNFNPNSIWLVVSSDGGNTFSAATHVNSNGYTGPEQDAVPQLAVSGGTAGVPAGQVNLVYEDFHSGSQNKPPQGNINYNSTSAGVASVLTQSLTSPNGNLNDAGAGIPNVPATTTFTQTVNITDPRFVNVSNLTVTLNLIDPDLSAISIQLVHGNTTLTLLRNRTDAAGNTVPPAPALPDGTAGANLGNIVGTVFDMNAERDINTASGASAPFDGHFIPDYDPATQLSLNAIDGLTAAQIDGTWTLEITVFRNFAIPLPPALPPRLLNWTLDFTSGLTPSSTGERTLASTNVLGALTSPFPLTTASSPRGIGPAPVIASDNTSGVQLSGRLYIAYVDRVVIPQGISGPLDYTNIELLTSTNGGLTWSSPAVVNDNFGVSDGFSGTGTGAKLVTGRPVYQPAVAVDQSTGTLVLSWYDTRNDPSIARVARYVTTSIDGGASFSPDVFVNTPETATDEITGNTVVLGPIPDNISSNNPQADGTFGFGDRQGMAVAAGHIVAVYSGNLNGGFDSKALLDIFSTTATFAAGPRIVDSTQGVVQSGIVESDGTVVPNSFVVTFDRPIDPNSFGKSQATVRFRDAHGDAPVTLTVTGVNPLNATQYQVTFDPTLAFQTDNTYVGTYSYAVGPDIRDRIQRDLYVQFPANSTTSSTATLSNVSNNTIPNSSIFNVTVNLTLTTAIDKALTITLISPNNTSITLAQANGGNGANFINTTFDDGAPQPIFAGSAPFTGSFQPITALANLDGQFADGTWTLQITDAAGGAPGVLLGWSARIEFVSGQFVILNPGPGNLMDQNANGTAGENPGDIYAVPQPIGGGGGQPFQYERLPGYQNQYGQPQPTGLPFQAPYNPNTLPLIVPGPHIVHSFGGASIGTDNLVLNGTISYFDVTFDRNMNPSTFTPGQIVRFMGPVGLIGPNGAVKASFSVLPNPQPGEDPNHPRTFRINFLTPDGMSPLVLNLSGTYTLTLGPNILSQAGDAMDTNENAGLDILRQTPSAGTSPVTYNATNTPITITAGQTIKSAINITDNYLIQGITLQLNITYPHDTDLQAILIGPNNQSVTLFSGIGANGNQQNFTNTVFDDGASTPIEGGTPPFAGRFNPLQPLSVFSGGVLSASGTWTLEIIDSGTGTTSGTLNSWSLRLLKPVSASGLGEPVADQATVSFRIFTMNPSNPLSSSTWTSVGPGEDSTGHGRIGGIAVDPSDPSGNTVYIGGASGGVWKTTDFLTSAPGGPTYIPLTDFGPTFGINIGGLAVFGRNNDTTQTIVFAATGEGDTGSQGVGFLRSMDGGATWTLLDSSTNVDANGNVLPLNSSARDHIFDGTSSFKILVDPHLTPSGNVIVYAGLSGPNGGIWRSTDTGNHWSLMRAGRATDIVFDPNSGHNNSINNPTGNLDVLYAAFAGDGVYVTPNRGQVWTQLLGGTGDPTIFSGDSFPHKNVPVDAPTGTPNGAKGRIDLAKPFLTGNPVQDLLLEGWLYALVVAPSGHLDGLYLTKDFGQNWTKVGIPTVGTTQSGVQNAIPTNDSTQPNYDVFGGGQFTQGNYDVSLGIDPINPNIVYLGGTADGQPTGFIRVDSTGLSDPHAFFLGNNKLGNNDNGKLRTLTTDPVALDQWPNGTSGQVFGSFNPFDTPYINLIRNPFDIFGSPQLTVFNTLFFANTGTGATWTPFDMGGTDQHRIVTLVDPLTGQARLIIGDDQGIYSALDLNGVLSSGIAKGGNEGGGGSADRNGNLQIAQFYYGASQPSWSQFYTGVQDGASFASDPNVVNDGNLAWTGGPGDSGGVATDQTGSGTLYQYIWPCCGGNTTDFFQVNGTGRTFGLIQQSGGIPVPDPQWPFGGGLNFAVNPIDGNQIIISSAAGRIFSTADQGQTWFVIAEPTILDGTPAFGLAFGAPDPNDPSGALNDFLYVGTNGGHIYVTFDGGGAKGNDWINLSAGLDGSAIQAIVTNPNRGSHEAYAVTSRGVYHMVDATVSGAKWVNITGNLFQITHNLFAPFNDSTQLVGPQLLYLTSIQADWRYAIPNNPAQINNPITPPGPTHPVLYVGGEGGVFRSIDGGNTWTPFPDVADDGAAQNGGYLPNAHVTDLKLAYGNIDPTTGKPDQTTGPDVLLATTYGRGAFAIRVAPLVLPNEIQLDPNRPAPGGSISGPNKGATTTNVLQPVFDGMSELSTLGNTVKIQLFDLTNGLVNPPEIGFDPANPGNDFVTTDGNGRFFIQVMPGYFKADGTTDGPKIIGIQATDGAGAIGTMETFNWTLNTTPFIHNLPTDPNSPHFDPNGPLPPSQGGSDSGLSPSDKITNVTQPIIDGLLDQSAPTQVTLTENGTVIGSGMTNANGTFSIQIQPGFYGPGGKFADGLQTISIVAPHGGLPSNTVIFTFTEVTVAPPAPPAPSLLPASDSGFSSSDHVTSVTRPTFSGTGQTNPFGATIVLLYANGTLVGSDTLSGLGQYDVTVSPKSLADGTYQMQVRLEDVAGNMSPLSPPMTPALVISTTTPTVPTIKLDPGYNTGPAGQKPPQTAASPQLFDGTSDANTQVQILDNGTVIDTFMMGSAKSFSRLENLADGDHLLTVVATNLAGNTATLAPPYEVIVNPTALDKDLLFVRALYFQDLGRPGSLPEWQGWLGALALPNGRFLVANAIERSPECRDDQVIGLYLNYLGRRPGNGEEQGWVNQLLAGATLESVQAGILGSPEYFNRTPAIVGASGPASNTTFIEAVYSQLLSRMPAPSELTHWLSVVASSGRTPVAALILSSAEYRADVVTLYYEAILRRPTLPSAGEVTGWVDSGLDLITILIQFEASPEYFLRVTGFQP